MRLINLLFEASRQVSSLLSLLASSPALLFSLAPVTMYRMLSSWVPSSCNLVGFVFKCHLSEPFPEFPTGNYHAFYTQSLIPFSPETIHGLIHPIFYSLIWVLSVHLGSVWAAFLSCSLLNSSTGSEPGTWQGIHWMNEGTDQGHKVKKRSPLP